MRYVSNLILMSIITFPLLSINWFTWQSWVSVSLILTWYYWIQTNHAENLYNSALSQTRQLISINEKLEKISNLIKRSMSDSDAISEKITSELEKIRRTIRHEIKDL